MKSITTFLFLFSSLVSFSQSLILDIDTVNIALDEYIDYGTIGITNTSSQTIEVGITLTPECYISDDDTKIQICIGQACFAAVNEETTWGEPTEVFLTLAAGETSDQFKFTPFVQSGAYGSDWTCSFFDVNDTRQRADLNVKVGGECKSVSTSELDENLGPAYPNPAQDYIRIPVSNLADEVVIFNRFGERLAVHKPSNSEHINVNLVQYSSGLYFYQRLDADGRSQGSAAFVKK